MRIAVIGAGGVGGYFGGRLAASGCEVVFVQRGPHLAAMKSRGLEIISDHGDLSLAQVAATDDPARIGEVDFVLVTVKSGATDTAATMARTMLGPRTAVLSLQNGVENEARLAAILGAGPVMGGVAYILSLIEAPGVIRQSGPLARLVFGERDGRKTARAGAFLAACENAGIDAELTDNVEAALWAKFIVLCPHNGMTALTRLAIGPIRDDPDCRALLLAATDEVVAVARAKGIALEDSLIAASMTRFDRMPADMTSSMHYDLTHGKPLELDWLNGAVVRMGRECGIATPVNDFIYAALKLHRNGR